MKFVLPILLLNMLCNNYKNKIVSINYIGAQYLELLYNYSYF